MDNNFLFDRLSIAFEFYTDKSLFTMNEHVFIDSRELYLQFSYILTDIHIRYNRANITDYHIMVKDDMKIKVFVLPHCVIRICQTKIYYTRYYNIFEYIIKLDNHNLEHIYNIYHTDKYIIIVSKCIIPLVTNNIINKQHIIDYTLIRNQIGLLINKLIIDGYSHNDVRIDNIGYDPDINKYVLFDFDKFRKSDNNNDRITLDKSINYYKYDKMIDIMI